MKEVELWGCFNLTHDVLAVLKMCFAFPPFSSDDDAYDSHLIGSFSLFGVGSPGTDCF